ncbi:agmatinase [Aliamphritea ceti]|uniref:agmatinase n=1 Tax=Aliamphritea ceti TaxID=1524258 RepID=UPI0021C34AA1|nr:agmatinase [Aliamphritea ceti]
MTFQAVSVLGIPLDFNSSHLTGAAEAPPIIHKILHNGSANLSSESGVDIGKDNRLTDAGMLTWPDQTSAFPCIQQRAAEVYSAGHKLLSIGGDHSITYPLVKGLQEQRQPLTILHFDAHPDLYDELLGNRHSHACPFARIMEEQLADRLIQVGIRTLNAHQRQQAEKFGVEVHEMRHWQGALSLDIKGPVYISIDLDALDPAFAPGVSHHEPGGLTVREVLTILQQLDAPVIGADIVEYNPSRDINDMTAMVCAKLYKELAALLLKDCQQS